MPHNAFNELFKNAFFFRFGDYVFVSLLNNRWVEFDRFSPLKSAIPVQTPFLRRLTVRAFEALEGRSGLDQGAVDREVIRREQVLTASQAHYFVEETPGNVGGDQSLAQAAEIRLVEPFALEVHVKKPAKRML